VITVHDGMHMLSPEMRVQKNLEIQQFVLKSSPRTQLEHSKIPVEYKYNPDCDPSLQT
jgi:hypothetical protein